MHQASPIDQPMSVDGACPIVHVIMYLYTDKIKQLKFTILVYKGSNLKHTTATFFFTMLSPTASASSNQSSPALPLAITATVVGPKQQVEESPVDEGDRAGTACTGDEAVAEPPRTPPAMKRNAYDWSVHPDAPIRVCRVMRPLHW